MSIYQHRYTRRPIGRAAALLVPAILVSIHSQAGEAHVFVSKSHRVGAFPPHDGSGWLAEVFLDIPNFDLAHLADVTACMHGPGQPFDAGCERADLDRDGDVDMKDLWRLERDYFLANLIAAERFADAQVPDFTFKTDWIDFPAGPQDSDLDANFKTMGDFFNDHIRDVSDPEKLDEPFGSFFVRFTGLVKVTLDDEVRIRDFIDLPVWVEFGTMGYDGYRTRVGETVYRISNVNWGGQPFFNFGPSIETAGLYPIEVTYFNSYDPTGVMGYERAGVELYSWHGGGLAWPAGQRMIHQVKGPGTLLPPRVVYQLQDVLPLVRGDFDADADVDLRDFRWLQVCFDPNVVFPPFGCDQLDFDADGDVELDDQVRFLETFFGPGP